jgi:hypothetical protein
MDKNNNLTEEQIQRLKDMMDAIGNVNWEGMTESQTMTYLKTIVRYRFEELKHEDVDIVAQYIWNNHPLAFGRPKHDIRKPKKPEPVVVQQVVDETEQLIQLCNLLYDKEIDPKFEYLVKPYIEFKKEFNSINWEKITKYRKINDVFLAINDIMQKYFPGMASKFYTRNFNMFQLALVDKYRKHLFPWITNWESFRDSGFKNSMAEDENITDNDPNYKDKYSSAEVQAILNMITEQSFDKKYSYLGKAVENLITSVKVYKDLIKKDILVYFNSFFGKAFDDKQYGLIVDALKEMYPGSFKIIPGEGLTFWELDAIRLIINGYPVKPRFKHFSTLLNLIFKELNNQTSNTQSDLYHILEKYFPRASDADKVEIYEVFKENYPDLFSKSEEDNINYILNAIYEILKEGEPTNHKYDYLIERVELFLSSVENSKSTSDETLKNAIHSVFGISDATYQNEIIKWVREFIEGFESADDDLNVMEINAILNFIKGYEIIDEYKYLRKPIATIIVGLKNNKTSSEKTVKEWISKYIPKANTTQVDKILETLVEYYGEYFEIKEDNEESDTKESSGYYPPEYVDIIINIIYGIKVSKEYKSLQYSYNKYVLNEYTERDDYNATAALFRRAYDFLNDDDLNKVVHVFRMIFRHDTILQAIKDIIMFGKPNITEYEYLIPAIKKLVSWIKEYSNLDTADIANYMEKYIFDKYRKEFELTYKDIANIIVWLKTYQKDIFNSKGTICYSTKQMEVIINLIKSSNLEVREDFGFKPKVRNIKNFCNTYPFDLYPIKKNQKIIKDVIFDNLNLADKDQIELIFEYVKKYWLSNVENI